ncbi:DUF887-domain-containing protein [Amylocystis lapponica]|nr:DUF887-domain-containing protein [Amylocystis lapponica]
MASLIHQTNAHLSDLARPLAHTLNLPHLPPHFPALVYSFIGWVLLHRVVSPALSARLCPESYGKLRTPRAVNNWNIQVVSFLHVFVVVPLAARCLTLENLKEDKINGWDERLGTTVAVACGYFLWDCVDALLNFDDAGFLLHGISCLIIYGGIFRPFLGYYACRFLSWELSTIFLNIHRFLDKTGRTGGTAQYINGAALLGTFFSARIAWGWYKTFDLYQTLYAARHEVPLVYLVLYGCGSSALHSLNAVWFYKMVRALKKRFDPVEPAKAVNGKVG